MGRPMGGGSFPGSTFWTVEKIVVSVGPYPFHTTPALFSSSSARFRVIVSPPHRAVSPLTPRHPVPIRARQVAGVAAITVHPDRWISLERRAGSDATSRDAM